MLSSIAKKIKSGTITTPLISQLIRSGTSIGANYLEANGSNSKKDFRNKIFICKKESQETRHWLRMLKTANNGLDEDISKLLRESNELSMIFNKIVNTLDNKN